MDRAQGKVSAMTTGLPDLKAGRNDLKVVVELQKVTLRLSDVRKL